MLHIHRAERSDRLLAALADVVARPLADPFATEIVAVPTRGIERWLAQRLSTKLGSSAGDRTDGVCANVDFPFPGTVVGGAVAAATGVDRDADPWRSERSVWPLLEVVEECLDEEWITALAAHLSGGGADAEHRRDRRYGVVRHIADLYERYAVNRPAMLRAWREGASTAADGTPLAADVVWQAQLWRCLRERIGTPNPAERLVGACEAIAADRELVDLPERVSLYGLTRLPASHLDVLRAVAARRDVHLFLLHPSPALWEEIASSGEARGIVRRSEDLTAGTASNRLLATWGRDARELQLVLAGGSGPVEEHHHRLQGTPTTLLERLQADVRADRMPPGSGVRPAGAPDTGGHDDRPLLGPDDRSLAVHACHGRARQVEVVRDAILHALADDPELEPRDVIVMCPDIETFAPLIHATFGAGHAPEDAPGEEGARLPDLRVRLADRALRQTNPVLGTVASLLELAAGRVTASQVLDLAGREPIRCRFRFDDDDLARIEGWAASTGVRWGLDASHRAPFKLETLAAGTWQAGLDRVLLGVAMTEDAQRLPGGILPLDDVDSGDIDLAGRLTELLARLQQSIDALGRAQPIGDWTASIGAAADALCATPERDAWQRAQLDGILEDLTDEAAGTAAPLTPAEVRALLADRLRGRPTRTSFRTGHLTVCTLVPMRSVPHKVVCLLGLDDAVFPRKVAPDGDDLLARDPHVGDRDPRSEDRQLLLDALLAAERRLVITYAGRDERTNAPLPPAVPIGELLDVVDATVRVEPHAGDAVVPRARSRVVVEHPLQTFDVRNFTPAELLPDRAWGFDPAALGGARALAGPRHDPPPFLAAALPRLERDVVPLDDLVRFVQHPTRALLRQRLGMGLGTTEDEPDDALPVELGALEEWDLGQRLLDARLAGADPARVRAAELARGTLPPGRLAVPVIDRIGPLVDRLVAEADALLPGHPAPATSVEVDVALPDGRALVGTVAGVHGDLLRAVTYSRVAGKHRLAAWVRLLALTAAHPGRAFSAATVGRAPRRPYDVAIVTLPRLGDDADERRTTALSQLAVLLDLHDRGLADRVPLYAGTSAAWVEAAAAGRSTASAVADVWTSAWRNGFFYEGEDVEAGHVLVLGGTWSAEQVLAEAPRPDEQAWAPGEPTRLGCYARCLWDAPRAHEQWVLR